MDSDVRTKVKEQEEEKRVPHSVSHSRLQKTKRKKMDSQKASAQHEIRDFVASRSREINTEHDNQKKKI